MSLMSMLSRLAGSTSVPAIDHDAFEKACREGQCCVIDVREPHEFAAGHIPNAINHPLSQFDPSQLPKDKPVVLVCQAGGRSARALQQAHAAGRTDIIHYAGGTGGWRAKGGPVTS
jgi:rhodanese-related sulfurtransferase